MNKLEQEKKNLLEKLFALQRFGIKPGLDRTLSLLDTIGNPHNKLRTIHVAGTNGKGSVCSIIASILTESGYKTGLYTSPHISNFNERIRINGIEISDDELIDITKLLLKKNDAIGGTFFEITTAIAFYYFSINSVDCAVIETGLGGRLDATNVVNPLLSIITSIDLEHTEYLGNTIQAIAYEKAGIIKESVPCVCGVVKNSAIDVIKNICNNKNAEYINLDSGYCNIIQVNDNLTANIELQTYFQDYGIINTSLTGANQVRNILLASTAMERLRRQFPFKDEYLVNGIENVRKNTGLRFRAELVSKTPTGIIDVAHNPAAIEELSITIKKAFPDKKFNILFAAMQDKDAFSMLIHLKQICNNLIITKPDISRASSTELLYIAAKNAGFDNIIIEDNVSIAYQKLLEINDNYLICGSFYLLGDLL